MSSLNQNITTTSWLRQRKLGTHKRAKLAPTKELMNDIKLEATLEGHSGCVNCIEWNQNGNLLASGSDDRAVIVWDPFKRKLKHKVTPRHLGTIFSVKFMPGYHDTLVASSASDASVKLTDVISGVNVLDCQSCHSDRVKRLAVHHDEPHLIWSSGEDGLILQYDIREAHICRNYKARNILVDLKSIYPTLKAKCLAVNPVRSEMLAVGATDVYNRLFDRRYMKLSNKENSSFRYFAPGHLLTTQNRSNYLQSYGTTYLSFNRSGSELLASVHAEQVYLFDLNEPWERYKTFDSSLHPLLLDKPTLNGANKLHYDLFMNSTSRKTTTKRPKSSWKPVHWTSLMHCREASKLTDELRAHIDTITQESNLDLRQARARIEYVNSLLRSKQDCPELYLARSRLLMARGWRGDYYQAMRDCCCALALEPLNQTTIKCLAQTLVKLGHTYYCDGLIEFIESMIKYDSPHNQELLCALEGLRVLKKLAPHKINCDSNNDCDIITDNNLDQSSLIGPLLSVGVNGLNSSCADMHSLLGDRERRLNETKLTQSAYDYTQRFCGHCNMNTDIKEANFFGDDGDYIVGGSDDGAFYIWDKKTGNLVKAVNADYQVLNCVQPHPDIFMLATSGIESAVKLWSSRGRVNRDVGELETRCIQNQKYISVDPLEAMILMLYPNFEE